MSFSFGFSGDDVEEENDAVVQNGTTDHNGDAGSKFVGLPAEEHSLDDLVGTYVFLFFGETVSMYLDTDEIPHTACTQNWSIPLSTNLA